MSLKHRRRKRKEGFYWEGRLPSVSKTLFYSVSVGTVSLSSQSEPFIRPVCYKTRSSVRAYFLHKVAWDDADEFNSLLWSRLLTYPPTHVFSVSKKKGEISCTFFRCYLHLPFQKDVSIWVINVVGRYLVSMLKRYKTTHLLIASEDSEEFYLMCIFSVVKHFSSYFIDPP